MRSCGHISEEHKRRVGEGVRKAWERRYRAGYKPKGPKGQLAEIARVLMCDIDRAVEMVKWLDENHRKICAGLQECVQKYHLGLGGEMIDELVIKELHRLKSLENSRHP